MICIDYFGTSWLEWSWWEPSNKCNENHYWYNNKTDRWIVHGSPLINESLIEYDQSKCMGCNKINILRNIEYDIIENITQNIQNMNISITTQQPITTGF